MFDRLCQCKYGQTDMHTRQRFIHLVCTQNLRKNNIFYLLVRTCTRAYRGVRNVSSFENFAYVLNEWFPGMLCFEVKQLSFYFYLLKTLFIVGT